MEYSVLREDPTETENVEKKDCHKCSNDNLLTLKIDFSILEKGYWEVS